MSRTRPEIVHSASSSRARAPRIRSNLGVRILTATVGIPMLLLIDHLGGWPFGILLGVTAIVATLEFYTMLVRLRARPWIPVGVACAGVLAAWPLTTRSVPIVLGSVVVLLFMASIVRVLQRDRFDSSLLDWACTAIPPLYTGLFLGHLGLLRTVRHGVWWVLLVLLITWAYDSGAYFAGTWFGKTPFMAHVSPKKTVEGVVGGLLCATVLSLAVVPFLGITFWQVVLLAIFGGIAAQTGDLAESMVKRRVGVKDSGKLIPGHGGLLDRIDGLLFVAPVVAYGAMILGYAA